MEPLPSIILQEFHQFSQYITGRKFLNRVVVLHKQSQRTSLSSMKEENIFLFVPNVIGKQALLICLYMMITLYSIQGIFEL